MGISVLTLHDIDNVLGLTELVGHPILRTHQSDSIPLYNNFFLS